MYKKYTTMDKIYIIQKQPQIMMEVKKTVFRKVFGDSPHVKVLDFFLDNENFDYSKSTIAAAAEVSRITLEPILEYLIKLGIIKQTRNAGRAIMYAFNWDNKLAMKIREFDLNLSMPKIPVKAKH